MEIIDRLSAGDPEKKKYYIRLFLDTLEPELENLRGADIGAPQEPIRAILHKLKSQVQTIGAADAHAMMSCLLYTSPSPRDLSTSRMPSSA